LPVCRVGAYAIESFAYTATFAHTKGAIVREQEGEVFYILVSSKISTYDD